MSVGRTPPSTDGATGPDRGPHRRGTPMSKGVPVGIIDERGIEQGPYGAIEHFSQSHVTSGRRLYVGGLDKMINQQHNQEEVREILAGSHPIAISKRITPHPSTSNMPGKHHYCFVDFATAQEASTAAMATNGRFWAGGRLRVSMAREVPDRLRERAVPAKDNETLRKRAADDDPLSAGQQSSWRKRPANDHSGVGTSQPTGSLASASWRSKNPEQKPNVMLSLGMAVLHNPWTKLTRCIINYKV